MPVTRICASVDWSTNSGAGRWIGEVMRALTGPRSSIGSPTTLMMRPSVSGPTGTEIGAPVSTASVPRTRPSVVSIATVRTALSPRCCATSSTRVLPSCFTCSADKIAGRSPSNFTSTTAPMTWVMRPTLFFAMGVLSSLASDGLGTGDDLDQLLGDDGLSRAVIVHGQAVDHVAGIARRVVHRGHARAVLAGVVLHHGAEHLDRQVARQQRREDGLLVGLVFVDRPAAGG